MPVTDVVIIGSGIAALTAAKRLSMDKNVIIITKSKMYHSNSFHAQGGVAAAVHDNDHWLHHYEDTMVAGCYHNNEGNVKELVQNGSTFLFNLIKQGMEFDRDLEGKLHLGKEGAHLRRRILHAGGDATGKGLITFMLKQLKDKVTIIENEMALDLIIQENQCIGVTTKDSNGMVVHYFASATIIATGGCGGLYSFTSNDSTVTGDGIAMAYRAGVQLADLEFIQFHPTLLYGNGKSLGLVSEAVRGEGGFLINSDGELIMDGVHELKDLAPRDVVARAIYSEINRGQQVFLNITNVKQFASRFPTIHQLCTQNDVNINSGLLPISPGAHFMMGGIKANKTGQTSLRGLYAVGEVACTGVHGANRIASNSLLEGIVFGNMTAENILSEQIKIPKIRSQNTTLASPATNNLPSPKEIRKKMMDNVGVVRNKRDLIIMKSWLEKHKFVNRNLSHLTVSDAEVVNMLTVAWIITTSALGRTESRGGHYRSDYPAFTNSWFKKEIIRHISEIDTILV